MQRIQEILICPKCHCQLSHEFGCTGCGSQYEYRHGVANLISAELSGDQHSYWKITDSMLDNDDEDAFLALQAEEDKGIEDYQARKNQATQDAERAAGRFTASLMGQLSGVVCDLATGRGCMLQSLLDSENKNFQIVCTDLDPRRLAWTKKHRQTDDKRVFYVATDGRYLAIQDNCFDFITSFAAFGNIPESGRVAKELYRTLKPGGKLIIQGQYIQKDSRSFQLAKEHGLEKGLVEEMLMEELQTAGFQAIESTVVAEAVWSENPFDLLPAAGDSARYCVIQATK